MAQVTCPLKEQEFRGASVSMLRQHPSAHLSACSGLRLRQLIEQVYAPNTADFRELAGVFDCVSVAVTDVVEEKERESASVPL